MKTLLPPHRSLVSVLAMTLPITLLSGCPEEANPNVDAAAPSPDSSAPPVVGTTDARDTPPPPPNLAPPQPAPLLTASGAGTAYYVYAGSQRGIDILYSTAAGVLEHKSWVGYDPATNFRNGSFMIVSGNFLYLVSDAAMSSVRAYSIDPATGGLNFLNKADTGPGASLHLAVNRAKNRLLVVNYDGATMVNNMPVNNNHVYMFELGTDGRIGPLVGRPLEAENRAHGVYFPEPLAGMGRTLFVPTLGTGKVLQIDWNPAGLTTMDNTFSLLLAQSPGDAGVDGVPRQDAARDAARDSSPDLGPDASRDTVPNDGVVTGLDAAPAGPPPVCPPPATALDGTNPGPRHMDFSSDGTTAYLINELNNTIHVHSVNPATGRFTSTGRAPIQSVSTRPPTVPLDDQTLFGRSAEVTLHPSGRWLYATIRVDRCAPPANMPMGTPARQPNLERGWLVKYAVRATPGMAGTLITGAPSPPTFTEVNKEPRHFAISADGNLLIVGGQQDDLETLISHVIDNTTGDLTRASAIKTPPRWDTVRPTQTTSIAIYKKP